MPENANNEWDDLDGDPEARARAEHQATDADLLPPPNQPLAVARVLVERNYAHPDGLLLRFWRGSFWQWKQSHWIEAEEAQVRSSAYKATEDATYRNDKGQGAVVVPEPLQGRRRARRPAGRHPSRR